MRGLLFTFTHNITFIVKGEPGFCRQQRRSMDTQIRFDNRIGNTNTKVGASRNRNVPDGSPKIKLAKPNAPRLYEQLMETSSRIPPGHKAWSGNAFLIPNPSKASVRNSATFTDPNRRRLCHQQIYEKLRPTPPSRYSLDSRHPSHTWMGRLITTLPISVQNPSLHRYVLSAHTLRQTGANR